MSKPTPTLLESYRKANKERKAKMLEKHGYKTESGFLRSLGVDTKKKAAKKATKKKAAKKEAPKKVAKPSKEAVSADKPTDYVIAFDTTGSMVSYINSVKKHAINLVNTLFDTTPNLRIKVVAFGDYCDMKSAKDFGKAYQVIELTDNRQALVNFINSAENTSGGDPSEFYELVIKKINEETDWRDGIRSVMLIADYDPHPIGYSLFPYVKNNKVDWKKEAEKALKMGIQYDTLRIIPSMKWYAELSKITQGVCMDFKNANKISDIIEGSTYVRSNKAAFAVKMKAAEESGDTELIGAYKTMSTLL